MTDPTSAFRALVLERRDDAVIAAVRELSRDDLPEGDVVLKIGWSAVNYKDALAVTDRGRIVRRFPMVPGIDMAGTVVSSSGGHRAGDAVLVTGYGSGEDHWGGYTQLNRVRSEWLVPIPGPLDAKRAMAVGTAGLTAMLSVLALEEHGVAPGSGDVLVTGASGGVGSFAVALLARRGYHVVASTGRAELAAYLEGLGAAEILPREVLSAAPARPMVSERWAGAVDTAGGTTLANVIGATRRHGSIASCGLVAGAALETTVYPFILRGVNLLGIDSNYCDAEKRRLAWSRLAADLPGTVIDAIVSAVVGLNDIPEAAHAIMNGLVRGRVLVDLSS